MAKKRPSFGSRLLASRPRIFSSKRKQSREQLAQSKFFDEEAASFSAAANKGGIEETKEADLDERPEVSSKVKDEIEEEADDALPWKLTLTEEFEETNSVLKRSQTAGPSGLRRQNSNATVLWRKGLKQWRQRAVVGGAGDGEEDMDDDDEGSDGVVEEEEEEKQMQRRERKTTLLRETATGGRLLRLKSGRRRTNGTTWRTRSSLEDFEAAKNKTKQSIEGSGTTAGPSRNNKGKTIMEQGEQQQATTRVGTIVSWMKHDRIHAARALAAVCCSENLDEANRRDLRLAIPDLILMLEQPAEFAVAAQCIRNIAVIPELRPAALPAIEPLLSSLHTEDSLTGREEAAAALHNLSICESLQGKFLTHVPSLVHMLRSSLDDRIVEWTAAILANLAALKSGRAVVVQAGAILHLVLLLADRPTTIKLQAARALKNVCWNHFEYRALVATSGAIPLLIAMLDQNPNACTVDDQAAKVEALLALYNLATKSADIQINMVDAGIVPVLSRLLASSSTTTTPTLSPSSTKLQLDAARAIMLMLAKVSRIPKEYEEITH